MPLPGLTAGVADTLRNEAVAKVSLALDEVVAEIPAADRTEVVCAYFGLCIGGSHDRTT